MKNDQNIIFTISLTTKKMKMIICSLARIHLRVHSSLFCSFFITPVNDSIYSHSNCSHLSDLFIQLNICQDDISARRSLKSLQQVVWPSSSSSAAPTRLKPRSSIFTHAQFNGHITNLSLTNLKTFDGIREGRWAYAGLVDNHQHDGMLDLNKSDCWSIFFLFSVI